MTRRGWVGVRSFVGCAGGAARDGLDGTLVLARGAGDGVGALADDGSVCGRGVGVGAFFDGVDLTAVVFVVLPPPSFILVEYFLPPKLKSFAPLRRAATNERSKDDSFFFLAMAQRPLPLSGLKKLNDFMSWLEPTLVFFAAATFGLALLLEP